MDLQDWLLQGWTHPKARSFHINILNISSEKKCIIKEPQQHNVVASQHFWFIEGPRIEHRAGNYSDMLHYLPHSLQVNAGKVSWTCNSFSGLLCYVVWWLDTNISEDCAASINPEDGSSTVLWNFGIQPPHYPAHPRKPWIMSSPLWKPQISYLKPGNHHNHPAMLWESTVKYAKNTYLIHETHYQDNEALALS
jgi:hypothetical protein